MLEAQWADRQEIEHLQFRVEEKKQVRNARMLLVSVLFELVFIKFLIFFKPSISHAHPVLNLFFFHTHSNRIAPVRDNMRGKTMTEPRIRRTR